jgi:23S rRNA pseudouridine2605 synthase
MSAARAAGRSLGIGRGSTAPVGHVRRAAPRRIRLDRALSQLGLASRSEARALIAGGKVKVNGRVVRDAGAPVSAEPRIIAVEGRTFTSTPWRTILLNKPRGVVTTRRDPEGRRTVFDLLGDDAEGLVTVGRLDMASTGLLLLTTDRRLADRLTDPASAIVRRYLVTVRGSLTDETARAMEAGRHGLRAHSVLVRKRSQRETHLIVELTTGKNREIRRLCESVGHEVSRLKRVAFAGLVLDALAPGEWRDVTREEAEAALGAAVR